MLFDFCFIPNFLLIYILYPEHQIYFKYTSRNISKFKL